MALRDSPNGGLAKIVVGSASVAVAPAVALIVQVALLRNDFGGMAKDVAEIKSALKDNDKAYSEEHSVIWEQIYDMRARMQALELTKD